MALVPYRVSGAAADQRADERLLQLPGGITLRLAQWSNSTATAMSAVVAAATSGGGGGLQAAWPAADGRGAAQRPAAEGAAEGPRAVPAASVLPSPPTPQVGTASSSSNSKAGVPTDWCGPPLEKLSNVGLVVWQAGYLLAEYLLRTSPFGAAAAGVWRPLTVLDLGSGSGVVGIALALAGARVFLTDLPHVVPLTAANVAANCDPRRHRAVVCPYCWGDDPAAAAVVFGANSSGGGGSSDLGQEGGVAGPLAGVEPDVITAADVLYHPELLGPLMRAVQVLSAPHTVTYVSYRVRQGGEVAAFAALAEAAGFAVAAVPQGDLHEEYRSAGGRGSASAADGDGDGDGEEGQVEDADAPGAQAVEVECAGATAGQRPGTYGILRLCRRDCLAQAPYAGLPLSVVQMAGIGHLNV